MKLVSHNHRIFVGDVPNKFLWSRDTIPDPFTPPMEFFDLAESQTCDVYCNNMDIVRYYKPQNVIVCFHSDPFQYEARLCDHPQFEKWKDEMDSGEMFSLFGNSWVTNE